MMSVRQYRPIWARVFGITLLLFIIPACSQVYTPGYITRVLIRQDASTSDYLWKPAFAIPRSDNPQGLSRSNEVDRVRAAFRPVEAGMDMETYLESTSTTALLVLKDGQLLYENYFNGASAEDVQAAFSISKSLFSLLLGSVFEQAHSVSLEEAITTYLPELAEKDSQFSKITLADLIDMRSGIRYSNDVAFPFINQDAPLVYYAADLRAVILQEMKLSTAPGEFLYNDYNPNVLALAMERELEDNPLNLLHENLFEPIGSEDNALWSTDNHGFAYWESGLAATPRDLAKIGQLMLQGGEINGRRLISDDWHKRSTTSPETDIPATLNGRQWVYRNGWWQILRANVANDYAAIGRFGQMIYVSPSQNAVVVRTGTDENPPSDAQLTSWFYDAVVAL